MRRLCQAIVAHGEMHYHCTLDNTHVSKGEPHQAKVESQAFQVFGQREPITVVAIVTWTDEPIRR